MDLDPKSTPMTFTSKLGFSPSPACPLSTGQMQFKSDVQIQVYIWDPGSLRKSSTLFGTDNFTIPAGTWTRPLPVRALTGSSWIISTGGESPLDDIDDTLKGNINVGSGDL